MLPARASVCARAFGAEGLGPARGSAPRRARLRARGTAHSPEHLNAFSIPGYCTIITHHTEPHVAGDAPGPVPLRVREGQCPSIIPGMQHAASRGALPARRGACPSVEGQCR